MIENYKIVVNRWTGIRNDLELLMDEEISSVQLCGLHMEMRNTEQLLASIGLFAYSVGCLKTCNEVLSAYGPESFQQDRIKVTLKTGQETAVKKHNIHVASMSGILF